MIRKVEWCLDRRRQASKGYIGQPIVINREIQCIGICTNFGAIISGVI